MTYLDIYAFFESVEIMAQKIYKDQEENTYGDNITEFIDVALAFFEDFIQ